MSGFFLWWVDAREAGKQRGQWGGWRAAIHEAWQGGDGSGKPMGAAGENQRHATRRANEARLGATVHVLPGVEAVLDALGPLVARLPAVRAAQECVDHRLQRGGEVLQINGMGCLESRLAALSGRDAAAWGTAAGRCASCENAQVGTIGVLRCRPRGDAASSLASGEALGEQ